MKKACPVVIRDIRGEKQLLCFKHPLAGLQLVKGSIEPGESLFRACERELLEESGIVARAFSCLGAWDSGFERQMWGVCLMQPEQALANQWCHWTQDDGGKCFSFFWHPLSCPLPEPRHAVYERARVYITQALGSRFWPACKTKASM